MIRRRASILKPASRSALEIRFALPLPACINIVDILLRGTVTPWSQDEPQWILSPHNWFSLIFLEFHWFSWNFLDFHWFSHISVIFIQIHPNPSRSIQIHQNPRNSVPRTAFFQLRTRRLSCFNRNKPKHAVSLTELKDAGISMVQGTSITSSGKCCLEPQSSCLALS